jgi:hypothetical protein
MTPDMVNGTFELIGALILGINCVKLYKDKQVKGVSLIPVTFFTCWGVWNLYFYMSLDAWFSFFGSIAIALSNSVWAIMALYYRWVK